MKTQNAIQPQEIPVEQDITVDITESQLAIAYANQFDNNTSTVHCHIQNNGVDLDVSQYQVTLRVKKSNGKGYSATIGETGIDGCIIGNIVSFKIPKYITVSHGRQVCDLEFYTTDDIKKYSCTFYIRVNKSALDEQRILDSDNYASVHDEYLKLEKNINQQIADAMTENQNVVEALDNAISTKVDKIEGKGLSTEDYTTEEKNKLAQLGANTITGIKGNEENIYRHGDVNLTPEDIGALNIKGTTMHGAGTFTTVAPGFVQIEDMDDGSITDIRQDSIELTSKRMSGTRNKTSITGGGLSFYRGDMNIGNITGTEYTGNAASATQDSDGNVIVDTYLTKSSDTKDNIISFTSHDSMNEPLWTTMGPLVSGEKHSSILEKLSIVFKNIRYLYKKLGTTDISAISDGTVTGAIRDIGTYTGINLSFENIKSGITFYATSLWRMGKIGIIYVYGSFPVSNNGEILWTLDLSNFYNKGVQGIFPAYGSDVLSGRTMRIIPNLENKSKITFVSTPNGSELNYASFNFIVFLN